MEKTTVFECTIKLKMCEYHVKVWEEAGFEITRSGDSEEGVCGICFLSSVKNVSEVKEL